VTLFLRRNLECPRYFRVILTRESLETGSKRISGEPSFSINKLHKSSAWFVQFLYREHLAKIRKMLLRGK
jgi:hypothetical protein